MHLTKVGAISLDGTKIQADAQENQDGLDLPAELRRRENRKAALQEARTG